jgi:hypothetical protein
MRKLSILSISFFVLTLVSCKKEGATIGTIYVQNEAKVRVVGADVHLFTLSSETTVTQKMDSTYSNIQLVTDAEGKVQHDFSSLYKSGQAGVGVINFSVAKIEGSDTLVCDSYIQLEAEKETSVTVTIKKKKI